MLLYLWNLCRLSLFNSDTYLLLYLCQFTKHNVVIHKIRSNNMDIPQHTHCFKAVFFRYFKMSNVSFCRYDGNSWRHQSAFCTNCRFTKIEFWNFKPVFILSRNSVKTDKIERLGPHNRRLHVISIPTEHVHTNNLIKNNKKFKVLINNY